MATTRTQEERIRHLNVAGIQDGDYVLFFTGSRTYRGATGIINGPALASYSKDMIDYEVA